MIRGLFYLNADSETIQFIQASREHKAPIPKYLFFFLVTTAPFRSKLVNSARQESRLGRVGAPVTERKTMGGLGLSISGLGKSIPTQPAVHNFKRKILKTKSKMWQWSTEKNFAEGPFYFSKKLKEKERSKSGKMLRNTSVASTVLFYSHLELWLFHHNPPTHVPWNSLHSSPQLCTFCGSKHCLVRA